ncbi:MAG: lipoyl(octanoyl) transferase LipB [Pyrinomonadaceae bacterium]
MNQRNFLKVLKLDQMDYGSALKIQKEIEIKVRDGIEPQTLILVEHPHTFTLGRKANLDGIIAGQNALRNLKIETFETDRGGRVTYHGPGQLVGYPIINLSPGRKDVHKYLRDLEEVITRSLAAFQIESFRIDKLTGVYTRLGKVAAIGVHIARWVTTHGFALNVNTDLSFFNMIIPCEGEPVTSMEKLLGAEVRLNEVEDRIIENFTDVFDLQNFNQ